MNELNQPATPDLSHPELVAVVLTLNESEHIADCVHSLNWADRVIVFDSYSEDKTVSLAKAAGAQVLQSHFENYAQQRNAALEAIRADWVFFVDADERGTPALAEEVRAVISQRSETGWYVPRYNYIFGHLTKGAGWYPDYQLRLFKHGRVHYERPVHETAVVDGGIGYLQEALIHYNYRDKGQFQAKQKAYTAYDAAILRRQNIRPRPHNYVLQPWRQFWWRYVTLRGYQDGWHGLKLSLFMAYYEWVKYRKLAALWQN